jgi:hypothetical protein
MELVREAAQHTTPAISLSAPVATRESRPLVSRVMNYRRNASSSFLALTSREAIAQ